MDNVAVKRIWRMETVGSGTDGQRSIVVLAHDPSSATHCCASKTLEKLRLLLKMAQNKFTIMLPVVTFVNRQRRRISLQDRLWWVTTLKWNVGGNGFIGLIPSLKVRPYMCLGGPWPIFLGHAPQEWRMSIVAFITQTGKIDHTTPKDVRPISLTSCLLETRKDTRNAH